ncbi:ribosomal protein S18 acetylase RimI-like enzyme [Ereboglobus sp. PH5-5]|uniref:GNAT family N-acetyltransferase n=1 Tax=Ereboglobus sp. PH5-5 TaxID=2940529 RepID=UPI00240677B1|nr:GNAT family N-acetyltransferase [Ereboglobus sp. PH5-5]MDF9832230.1 ribosomal protein S18 acetylase RimI-like enzyme [Ereboglobus sp. PH5-5]
MSATVEITGVSPKEIPMELLLQADPSEEKLKGYLPLSTCFAAWSDGVLVGACAVIPTDEEIYELMCISVAPAHRQKGVGAQLLRHVIAAIGKLGANQLTVGTGSFGYQLSFYQRQGFRVSSIDRDFFIKNYQVPIFENGIQLRDMLRLTFDYGKST